MAKKMRWQQIGGGTVDQFVKGDGSLDSTIYDPAPIISARNLNGVLITTTINYSQSEGDAFLLKIEGNMYGGGLPLICSIQGYIYSNAIINCTGVTTVDYFTTILALNLGGKLCFYFPRFAYWQGFSVKVFKVTGGGYFYAQNCVTSITEQPTDPGGTKRVNIPITVLINGSTDQTIRGLKTYRGRYWNTGSGWGNSSSTGDYSILLETLSGSDGSNQYTSKIGFFSNSGVQAGIYVRSNDTEGTSMAFATTQSFAAGPQIGLTLSNFGVVNFTRANPTVQGNQIWHAGNLDPNGYYKNFNGGISNQTALIPNGSQYAAIGNTGTNFDGELSNKTIEGTFANFNGYPSGDKSLGFTLFARTSTGQGIYYKTWYGGGQTLWKRLIDSTDIQSYALANGSNASGEWAHSARALSINPYVPGRTFNSSGAAYLQDATYGDVNGFLNSFGASQGNPADNWFHRIKMLHSNSNGYYTEIAVQMTSGNSMWYRRYENGSFGSSANNGWIKVWDNENLSQLSINSWNLAATYAHTHSNLFYLNNINQWLGVGQAPQFNAVFLMNGLGYGQLVLGEDNINGEIGLVDLNDGRSYVARENEYLKYGSTIGDFEAINIHYDTRLVGIGKEITNDEDKAQVRGNLSVETADINDHQADLILNPLYNEDGDVRGSRNAHIYIVTYTNVRLPRKPILGQRIEIFNRSDSTIEVIHDNVGTLFLVSAFCKITGIVGARGFIFDEKEIPAKMYDI